MEKKNKTGDQCPTGSPTDEDRQRIVHILHKILGQDPRQAITRPGTRAMILATALLEIALVLDGLDPEHNLGPVLRAAVESRLPVTPRINAAWRAYFNLTEERHKRLALIEAIKSVCEDTTLGSSTVTEKADIAKAYYSADFPEAARQLEQKQLELVVGLWRTKAGRRAGKTSKWPAIADSMKSADLGGGSATSIRREWSRYADEVKAAGGISGTRNR